MRVAFFEGGPTLDTESLVDTDLIEQLKALGDHCGCLEVLDLALGRVVQNQHGRLREKMTYAGEQVDSTRRLSLGKPRRSNDASGRKRQRHFSLRSAPHAIDTSGQVIHDIIDRLTPTGSQITIAPRPHPPSAVARACHRKNEKGDWVSIFYLGDFHAAAWCGWDQKPSQTLPPLTYKAWALPTSASTHRIPMYR